MGAKPAYEDATLAMYTRIRGAADAHLFPRLMENDAMRAFIQIAFEAGREWQATHPTAALDVPDYDAAKSRAIDVWTARKALRAMLSQLQIADNHAKEQRDGNVPSMWEIQNSHIRDRARAILTALGVDP